MAATDGPTVASLIVTELAAAGVREAFAVAGGALTPLLGALAEQGEIAYVGVRHEFAASVMAAATFHGTGRVAVALAEQGPGTLNALSGLGVAYNNRLPMLLVTVSGSAPLGAGALMELDATAATAAVTLQRWTVHSPDDAVPAIRAALGVARGPRPGPVHVDIPRHLIGAPASPVPAPEAVIPVTYPGDLERAVELLAAAERPVVLAGGGAAHAGAADDLRAIADHLGAVTLTTQMGLGVLPTDGPMFAGQGGVIGGPAVARAAQQADVLLAVGTRTSSWWWREGVSLYAGSRVVRIDLDPAVLDHADVALRGDAADLAAQLLARLRRQPSRVAGSWAREVHADYLAYRAELGRLAAERTDPIHPAALAAHVADLMTASDLLVLDGGHTTFWSNDVAQAREPRTVFHEPGMAQLGFGVPYANALARAYPDRRVVTVTGDGAFGFSLMELDTARRLGLRTITVIHDNARWGVIGLAQSHAGFSLGVDLEGTDYAAIATGLGCLGIRITDLSELPKAWEQAVESLVPVILDVVVSFVPHPMMPAFGRTQASAL